MIPDHPVSPRRVLCAVGFKSIISEAHAKILEAGLKLLPVPGNDVDVKELH